MSLYRFSVGPSWKDTVGCAFRVQVFSFGLSDTGGSAGSQSTPGLLVPSCDRTIL